MRRVVVTGANRGLGLELTRQLLAFSRKQIIEPTLLDMNLIVVDLRAMLERLIGENVKVVLALTPDLALVTADPAFVSGRTQCSNRQKNPTSISKDPSLVSAPVQRSLAGRRVRPSRTE